MKAKRARWTQAEDDIIDRFYPFERNTQLAARLGHRRTPGAIHARAFNLKVFKLPAASRMTCSEAALELDSQRGAVWRRAASEQAVVTSGSTRCVTVSWVEKHKALQGLSLNEFAAMRKAGFLSGRQVAARLGAARPHSGRVGGLNSVLSKIRGYRHYRLWLYNPYDVAALAPEMRRMRTHSKEAHRAL